MYIESPGLNISPSYHSLSSNTDRHSKIIVYTGNYFILHKFLYAIKCRGKGKGQEIYRLGQALRAAGG